MIIFIQGKISPKFHRKKLFEVKESMYVAYEELKQ